MEKEKQDSDYDAEIDDDNEDSKSKGDLNSDEERELVLLQQKKRDAKELRKKAMEEQKKNKRKEKKESKVKDTNPGSNKKSIADLKAERPTPEKNGKGGKRKEIIDQIANSTTEEISEKPLHNVDKTDDDSKNEKTVEVMAVFASGTVMKVGEDEILIPKTELERLEQIRKERERDAKEREIEKQRQEELKKQSMTELEKLQQNLALKNQMKNKKGKKK